MKTRITALFLMIAILLSLLSGCGTAKTEPETTAAPETEAPTTEPTTEPPTALEQMGFELWENASNVSQYGAPEIDGIELPVSRELGGTYPEHKAYFFLQEKDGRLLEDLVAAPVDIQIYEFPASSFDNDIDWIEEQLKPFYQYCKKQDSGDYSFKEWVNANQDKKLLWMHSTVKVDGTKLFFKAVDEGFKDFLSGGLSCWNPEAVNPITGEWSCSTENYDHYNNPAVWQWKTGVGAKETDILVFYPNSESNWYGDHNMQINLFSEMYMLLPAEFEDICFVMPEYTSVEAYKTRQEEKKKEPKTDALWETGNILEDYDTEKYNYYFYSLYSDSQY